MLPVTGVQCSSYWGSWGSWTQYFPSCIESSGLFNDAAKHAPQRFRERNCQIENDDGTITTINIADQECCPQEQKSQVEQQPQNEQIQCSGVFTNLTEAANSTLVETKVIVGFNLVVLEVWNGKLVFSIP